MESLSAHRPYGRRGIESEDERLADPSVVKAGFAKPGPKGLRRTLSSQDLSQTINKMRIHSPALERQTKADHTEELVEEKTIQAVYAQMKSLHHDPPVGDVGMIDFLDAMKSEVRRAVSDIRKELEESVQKNSQTPSARRTENVAEPQGTNIIQAVANIRKEYTAKLQESEKKVRELWSQIAVEERRCLELSKIVKELQIQSPKVVQTSTENNSSNRRRPLRRKNSAEKQIELKSLDEEAQKYFDECVSISSYNCQGDSDDSMQEKGHGLLRREREVSAISFVSRKNGNEDTLKTPVGSDGVVLPWLQWDAEAASVGEKNSNLIQKSGKVVSSKSSPSWEHGGSEMQADNSRNTTSKVIAIQASGESSELPLKAGTIMGSGQPESEVHQRKSESVNSREEVRVSSTTIFTLDDSVNENVGSFLDVDLLLYEKIKFRCRVDNGELLLCQRPMCL
ncbi:hypothetical protein KP509_36G013300 [Ceratopteris richardii]|nr:hypothetical protein KP509_36G013300 [Ceratopteris richardii]